MVMATLHCSKCNHKFWTEFWWTGRTHSWVFFDDMKASKTHTERVTYCPECGEQIRKTHTPREPGTISLSLRGAGGVKWI
jgi:hypothetical protein